MATTIKIEDPIRPVRSIGNTGGVYPIRSLSADRHSLRSTDNPKQDLEDEDSGLRRAGDFKKKQVQHPRSPQLTFTQVLTSIDILGQNLAMASLPVNRSHLR